MKIKINIKKSQIPSFYCRHWMFRGSALEATVSQATSGEKSIHWKCPKNSINAITNHCFQIQWLLLNKNIEWWIWRTLYYIFFGLSFLLSTTGKKYLFTRNPDFLFKLEQENNGGASHVPVKCCHYTYSEKIFNLLWSQVMNPEEPHFLFDSVSTPFNFSPMREREIGRKGHLKC